MNQQPRKAPTAKLIAVVLSAISFVDFMATQMLHSDWFLTEYPSAQNWIRTVSFFSGLILLYAQRPRNENEQRFH